MHKVTYSGAFKAVPSLVRVWLVYGSDLASFQAQRRGGEKAWFQHMCLIISDLSMC